MTGKFGKLEPKLDARTLKFARYASSSRPAPKSFMNELPLTANLGMMGNDTVGDCTCAAVGHAVQVWTANAEAIVTVTDEDVLGLYTRVTGYDGTPATDKGAYCLDVLNAWRKAPVAGHTLDAYAKVSPFARNNVELAISEFGGLYIGVGLPTSFEGQVVWDDGTAPWSAGGHCVFAVGYDDKGVDVITWGTLQRMTWAFWNRYVDEAYALLDTSDWVAGGKSPQGFDVAMLLADLSAVTGG